MPRICYVPKRFSAASKQTIATADGICREYAAQGYTLTLRQLYYQFVSRGIIANRDTEYKRLGSILNDARLAGELDWSHMVDRTRNLKALSHWDTPSEIIYSAAASYRRDRWESQRNYVEVWIEKDALVGVIERPCTALDIPYFSCRGYTSQSELWAAAMRLASRVRLGKKVTILHLGDHDPSGLDMTRDIKDRLTLFMSHELGGYTATVDRLALNIDQVHQYGPPPNPAKLTDSRGYAYVELYGNESWELDALEPTVLDRLITDNVQALIEPSAWALVESEESQERHQLQVASDNWPDVAEWIDATFE